MHFVSYNCSSIKISLQKQQQPTYCIHMKPFSCPVVNIIIRTFIGKRQTNHFLKVQNLRKISVWHFQKDLLKIIIQPVVISVINRYITCNITKCCYKNFKRTTAGSCIEKMMPFSNMTDMQLNRLMKERYVISPTNDDLVSFILNCRKRPRYRNI